MNWTEFTRFDFYANNHRSFSFKMTTETKASEHYVFSNMAVVYNVANNASHFNLQELYF